MTRSDRRGQHGHTARGGARKKEASPMLDEEQRAQVAALLANVSQLAGTLRTASTGGRDAIAAELAPVTHMSEPVARTFAERLGDLRGAAASEGIDVAQAIGELDARRTVAREARRARLRLRSVGAAPALIVPPIAITTPPPAGPVATATTSERASVNPQERLVEAYVSRTRDQGEVSLILGWRDTFNATLVRGDIFELSFWEAGVKQFATTDAMSPTRFRRELLDPLRAQQITLLPVTWAQARRLVLDALEVNTWRGVEPDPHFQRDRAQITERLLAEPVSEAGRAAIAEEAAQAARTGDRAFIAADMEPDEMLANWIGAWTFGDFGLTYDLLADDHVQRQHSRDEYIALRRQWMDESKPASLRLTLIREQTQRASALWVPGSAGTIGTTARKELEAFWSVVLHEAAIGGQLDELPMATLASKESGRHWYWTAYTVTQDAVAGLWLISRFRDEGAASQGLAIDELQRRIKEAHEDVDRITAQKAPDPQSPEATDALHTITGALTSAMHYSDALIARMSLDENAYRTAIDDARALANHERAAALFERMRGRFADDVHVRFELGLEQYLVSEQYASQGQVGAAEAWLERAVATMAGLVAENPTVEHLQGLGELLSRQGHYNQAEVRLREAIQLDAQRAILHSDLADALMGRVSGENLDDPVPLSREEQQALAREALAALRETSRLDSSLHGVYTRMGAIYEALDQGADARIAFEEAVRHDPGDAEARYALGALYLTDGQAERARPYLEQAVQLAPLAVPYRLSLAAAYGELGRIAEGLREVELVERLRPGLPQTAELRAALERRRRQKR